MASTMRLKTRLVFDDGDVRIEHDRGELNLSTDEKDDRRVAVATATTTTLWSAATSNVPTPSKFFIQPDADAEGSASDVYAVSITTAGGTVLAFQIGAWEVYPLAGNAASADITNLASTIATIQCRHALGATRIVRMIAAK